MPGKLQMETGDRFSELYARGYETSEIVGMLAEQYGVVRPTIWRRLYASGALKRKHLDFRREHAARRESKHESSDDEMRRIIERRVVRDPCPWCETRRDVGCKHLPLRKYA